MNGTTMLILEGEHYNRKYFKTLMLEHGIVEGVCSTVSGNKAIELVSEYSPDIALLDIELPEQNTNGIEIAKLIKQVQPDIEIIFLADHDKYALESFMVHPFDFLLKPVNEERLLYSVSLLKNKLNNRDQSKSKVSSYACFNCDQTRLVLKEPKRMLFIPIDDILFIEKQKNQNKVIIYLQTADKYYESSKKLNVFEVLLTEDFMRTHRSYIVNLNKVTGISEDYDRSYVIEFNVSEHKALLSRYKARELQMKMSNKYRCV